MTQRMQNIVSILFFLIVMGILFGSLCYLGFQNEKRNEKTRTSIIRPSYTYKIHSEIAGDYVIERVHLDHYVVFVIVQNGKAIGLSPKPKESEK